MEDNTSATSLPSFDDICLMAKKTYEQAMECNDIKGANESLGIMNSALLNKHIQGMSPLDQPPSTPYPAPEPMMREELPPGLMETPISE